MILNRGGYKYLLRVDDVHDDAPLQHLRKPSLDTEIHRFRFAVRMCAILPRAVLRRLVGHVCDLLHSV